MASGLGIGYLDGPRLRRSLLAGADWVAAGREELNRLNVFPIPDGDTGTNLCLTLGEVARAQSGGLFTVENLARLVRSGRVGRVAAWLGTKLDVKPVMAILPDGTVDPAARARGAPATRRRLLALLARALAGGPRALRLGIVHADIPAFATALQAELVARYRPKPCLVSPITPVIAAHAGIGAWGVFYQIEDGTNTSPARYD